LDLMLRRLKTVAEDQAYLGVVVYLDQPELTLPQIDALARAFAQVRQAGKRVLTFAESYDLSSYLLASQADLILLQHKGSVELRGLAMEEVYLAGLLEKIGAKADLMQVGQFKGADEALTRTGPSEAWDSNINALLDDLYAQVVDRIAKGRGLTTQQVEDIIRDSWTMSDTDYLRRHVVDRLTDRDLVDVTEVEFGESFVWDDTMGQAEASGQEVDSPLALLRLLFQEPDVIRTRRDTLAVIHARGPVISGDSEWGGGLFGGEAIGSRTIAELLGEAREDDHIKGVILRIDSPGGSALASEMIWQAVRDLAEQKPVYASIDGLAASGGYYVASAADRIYAAPQSVVGSIGVVGGKIVLGSLYEKVGVHVHRRSRGPMADMFNSVEPFTPGQREALQAGMQRVYDQFLDRVAAGRGRRLTDLDAVAQGRIFTGRQAVDNGLADELGGLDEAVADLARRLGLEEGGYDVLHLPPPMSLGEFINSIFGVRSPVSSAALFKAQGLDALASEALGPQGWSATSQVLGGLMLLRREPVLTLMPYALIVR
ncbi:MAG TPA: signal peptide peptidase SppA, partial [Phycisphaeraceae bacterium]